MKRIFCLFILATIILMIFSGCSGKNRPVTCDEVIAAYKEAGYAVSHRDYPEKEYGYVCMVRIEEEDGDSIEFHFHETEEAAEAEAEERQWNALLWGFSVIYGDPTWLTTETYCNIEIEYDNADLYEPFEKLIK